MKKQITIIGATGHLGAPVVKHLCGMGYQVKVIVRNIQKAQKIFSTEKGIKIIRADLNDLPALKAALSDTAYLYLNLSTTGAELNASFRPEVEGVANILKAVNRERIEQILMISGLGAMENTNGAGGYEFLPNIIRKQGHALVKKSGIPYTILHCSWFADTFVAFRRKNVYTVIGNNEAPIYFTNSYNYTVHVINAIGNRDAFYREFPIQGSQGYIHSEAATSFQQICDPTVAVKVMPYAVLKTMALFIKDLRFVRRLAEYSYRCPESFLAGDFKTYEVLGKPELGLEEFAEMCREKKLFNYLES